MEKCKKVFMSEKSVIILTIIISFLISASLFADDVLNAGESQVWTSVEGNITYNVKVGDKVPKGAPLFHVISNDFRPEKASELEHQVDYYNTLYKRNQVLIKTHSIAEQDLEDSKNDYQTAVDDLNILRASIQQGYYTAPFDCVVTKLLYLNGSGIGDGNPAINIKKIDSSANAATKQI